MEVTTNVVVELKSSKLIMNGNSRGKEFTSEGPSYDKQEGQV